MSRADIRHGEPTVSPVYWAGRRCLAADFPPLEEALDEPDGLVAIGGDLSPERLLDAYRRGIFPWYSAGQPVLWWSPDPRAVLWPAEFRASRSLRQRRRRGGYEIRVDSAFDAVIRACAAPRGDDDSTWITNEMRIAYSRLHTHGYAHSVECWIDDNLAGGLYGVAIGGAFFGESMFSDRPDASKLALAALCNRCADWDIQLIDCQVHSPHLASLGARYMLRAEFAERIDSLCRRPAEPKAWQDRVLEPA